MNPLSCSMHNGLKTVSACLLLAPSLPALAQVSASGFGTVGYAVSDKSYAYQRFVDHEGTLKRDTVFGLQIDGKLNGQFSLVAQAKIAPSVKNENGWDPTLTWAFLSWRPSNDLLLRLGKVRIPYYLNSANLDVGVTYAPAQLPPELYSISTTNETNGLSFSHNWTAAAFDLTLDGYWGVSNSFLRVFLRDGLAAYGGPPRGAIFVPTRIDSKGLALTLLGNDNTFRASFHQAEVSRRDGGFFKSDFSFVPLGAGQGFYLPENNALLAPGVTVPSVDALRFNIFAAGFDVAIGQGYRLSGEYARRANTNAPKGGADTHGGYLSLQRRSGAWNPYMTVSRLLSTDPSLDLYLAANSHRVTTPPIPLTQATVINATQRFAADRLVVYDQGTLALGTSYSLSPTQKVKAEWAVTHIGKISSFVDAPRGGDVRHQNFNVLALSYNFTF